MPPLSSLGISNLVPPPSSNTQQQNTQYTSYGNGAMSGGLPPPPTQISQSQMYQQPNIYNMQQQNGILFLLGSLFLS